MSQQITTIHITTDAGRAVPTDDWVAWLRTDDGIEVKVTIDAHADAERASGIVHEMVRPRGDG
jgi:hypothetical protein